MWHYIRQEPDILLKLFRSPQTDIFAKDKGGGLKAVYFIAHGSSFNAAVSTLGYFVKAAGIRAYAYTPGNFCTGNTPVAHEDPASTLVIVISQTGTSSGTIKALEYASVLGFDTLSITAGKGSPVDVKADDTLYLFCGEENSNAKTKGYSATLMTLMMLALSLGLENGTLDIVQKKAGLNELESIIGKIPEVEEKALDFCKKAKIGRAMRDLYVLSSGMNFGTAQEGQLKLMETMCMPTMFNDIGEFSHGMHRSIDRESSVLLIKSCDGMKDQIEQSYQYLKNITDHVWMIDATGEASDDASRFCVPSFAGTQSVLLTTLVIQVMSVYAPEYNGKDPNRDSHNDFTVVAGTRS